MTRKAILLGLARLLWRTAGRIERLGNRLFLETLRARRRGKASLGKSAREA